MNNFILDDRELQVEDGKTILEVAMDEGIEIPTLCFHKELTPYGACRLCMVEIVGGGRPGLQASCLYRVTEGLIVKTDTERIRQARKIIFELLLARSPGSDKINKMAQDYGVTKTRISLESKADCIQCGLCVRVCNEIAGRGAINFAKRGINRRVQTPFDKVSEICIGCGACAYLCPTNAITIEEA